jgi:hypothetical protein
MTTSMFRPFGWTTEGSIARALMWAGSVAVAIAGASTLVALSGAIAERRRPLAMLAAAGAPAGVLRRSFFIQAMTPVAAGAVLAFACAALVVGGYGTTFTEASVWEALGPGIRVVALAIVATSVATGLSLNAVGRTIQPDALRTE